MYKKPFAPVVINNRMGLTQAQLDWFKAELVKFYKMYNTLVDYWNGKHNTYPIMSALRNIVQNMAFSGKNCHGYDWNKEADELYTQRECAEAICEYDKSYMSLMVKKEIEALLMFTRNQD